MLETKRRVIGQMIVCQGCRYYGSILVTDQLRPSAAPAIQALQDMKTKVALLTGDSRPVACSRIHCRRSRVVQVVSELLPEQKTHFITEEVRKGCTVPMLGEGINDALPLSEATVASPIMIYLLWKRVSALSYAFESAGILLTMFAAASGCISGK